MIFGVEFSSVADVLAYNHRCATHYAEQSSAMGSSSRPNVEARSGHFMTSSYPVLRRPSASASQPPQPLLSRTHSFSEAPQPRPASSARTTTNNPIVIVDDDDQDIKVEDLTATQPQAELKEQKIQPGSLYITLDEIRMSTTDRLFATGILLKPHVTSFEVQYSAAKDGPMVSVTAAVHDELVSIEVTPRGLGSFYCSCQSDEKISHKCMHLVAVMLLFLDRNPEVAVGKSPRKASFQSVTAPRLPSHLNARQSAVPVRRSLELLPDDEEDQAAYTAETLGPSVEVIEQPLQSHLIKAESVCVPEPKIMPTKRKLPDFLLSTTANDVKSPTKNKSKRTPVKRPKKEECIIKDEHVEAVADNAPAAMKREAAAYEIKSSSIGAPAQPTHLSGHFII